MISGPPGRPKERQDGPKGFQNGPPNAQEGFKKRALGRLQKRLHLAATVSSMRPDRAPCLSHCGARPANTSDHPSLTIGVPGDVRPWPPNHARTGHRPSHPRFEAKTFPPPPTHKVMLPCQEKHGRAPTSAPQGSTRTHPGRLSYCSSSVRLSYCSSPPSGNMIGTTS